MHDCRQSPALVVLVSLSLRQSHWIGDCLFVDITNCRDCGVGYCHDCGVVAATLVVISVFLCSVVVFSVFLVSVFLFVVACVISVFLFFAFLFVGHLLLVELACVFSHICVDLVAFMCWVWSK